MIATIVRLPLVALVAVSVLWALTLALRRDPTALLAQAGESLSRALPDPVVHYAAFMRAARAGETAAALLPRLPEGTTSLLRAGVFASALHSSVTLEVLPFLLLLVLIGVLGGTLLRERIRHGEGYASPTAAFVARYTAAAGILYVVLFAFTPLQMPYWTLYLACLTSSLGGCLYVANLPIRL